MILELFFDLASPYAYLGLTRLLAHPAAGSVLWQPVDVEAVKRAGGNIGPALRHLPAKLHYVRQDAARWARRYCVPFAATAAALPAPRLNRGTWFAMDRGVAPRYLRAAARLVWAEGADPESDAVLRAAAEAAALDVRAFLEYTLSPEALARQRDTLARARAAGVFGVPTAVLGDRLWWGNDRLHLAEAAWRETQTEEANNG